ncbi:MAG: hypothetical protein ACHP9V_07490 [Terriglobales bacterium]
MMRTLLLVLVLSCVVGSQQVRHAPTVEQCRADQRLWLAKVESETSVVSVSFNELHGWLSEMMECKIVDPPRIDQYYNVAAEINSEQLLRMQYFMDRHHLYNQFLSEDAQGKRR